MGEPTRDYLEWGPDLPHQRRTAYRDPQIDEPAARARIGEQIAKLIAKARSRSEQRADRNNSKVAG
jgi:hypothetical protein